MEPWFRPLVKGGIAALPGSWHSYSAGYTVKPEASVNQQGAAVRMSRVLQRLIVGDRAVQARVLPSWHAIVWVFIALVALFLTHPAGDPPSRFSAPVPMPPDLRSETLPGWP